MAIQMQEIQSRVALAEMAAEGPRFFQETYGLAPYEPLNLVDGTTGNQLRMAALLSEGTRVPHRLFPEPDPEGDLNSVAERILYRRLPTA